MGTVREYERISVPQVFYQDEWVGGSELLGNQSRLICLKQGKNLQHIHVKIYKKTQVFQNHPFTSHFLIFIFYSTTIFTRFPPTLTRTYRTNSLEHSQLTAFSLT